MKRYNIITGLHDDAWHALFHLTILPLLRRNSDAASYARYEALAIAEGERVMEELK